MRLKKKILGIILSLVLVLVLMPGMGLTALATPSAVSYQAASWDSANNKVNYTTESCTSYIEVTSGTTAWNDGTWYVVKDDVSISQYGNNRITVSGTVNLILCDGATLTAPLGITVADGSTLNIYAQSEGTGKLMIECRESAAMNAAIGGVYNTSGAGGAGGVVNIHGGEITARTISGQGAGIGGGYGTSTGGAGGTVTIYGGTVTTAGGSSGAGIGGGNGLSTGGAGGTVTIYGGTVTAVGSSGAGIGGGAGGSSSGGAGGTVTIYGGTVKTEAGGGLENSSVGIGGGYRSGGGRGTDGTLTLGTGMRLYGGISANPETNLSNHVAQSNGDYARSKYMTVNNVAEAASSDSGSGSSSSSGSSDSGNTSEGTSSDSSDDTNTNTDTSAKVPYNDVAVSIGSVNDITGTAAATAENNPFETKIINNSDEELKTLFSLLDTDVAQGVNVWLDIQDMSASVPQTDKTLIQNTADDYTVGLYLDINLFKKVGSNDATKVTETNGKVKASIVIPESLRKSGRTFELIRVHDGVATAIAGTYDEKTHVFTFETDKFSTYALAYKDSAVTSPKTGGSNDVRVWYLLLIVSLGGLGFLGLSKKKKVND